MTREEEIREAIDKIFPCTNGGRCYEQSIGASGFELGVQWADNHPKQGTVDLLQVWHPAEEVPQVERQVLGIDYDGGAGSGVFEFRSVAGIFIYGDLILDWDSVVRWAYIEDLLPKKK